MIFGYKIYVYNTAEVLKFDRLLLKCYRLSEKTCVCADFDLLLVSINVITGHTIYPK